MSELLFETIETIGSFIQKKELSPVELTKLSLARIQKHNSELTAFITVMEEEAINQAKQLEDELQSGRIRGPLHGIPIAVKDLLQTEGVRTTGGSKIFQDWIPDQDAASVQKLEPLLSEKPIFMNLRWELQQKIRTMASRKIRGMSRKFPVDQVVDLL